MRNNKKNIKTSLVMPVYNGASTLDRALKSIESQTCKIDEIIIVDDASNDLTSQIISEWKKHLPIIVFRNNVNLGVTRSLHHGVASASGDLIFRLDADDEWLPNHVSTILSLSYIHPSSVLYSTLALEIYKDKNKKSKFVSNLNVREKLLWDNPFVHSAVAFNKKIYDLVGGYMNILSNDNEFENFYAQDYSLWIRLLQKGSLASSNLETVLYYVTDGSVSRIKRNLAINVRLTLQVKAINAFYFINPFKALLIYSIVYVRFAINKINA